MWSAFICGLVLNFLKRENVEYEARICWPCGPVGRRQHAGMGDTDPPDAEVKLEAWVCVLLSLPYPHAGPLAGQAPDPHAEVVEEASPVIGTGPW